MQHKQLNKTSNVMVELKLHERYENKLKAEAKIKFKNINNSLKEKNAT